MNIDIVDIDMLMLVMGNYTLDIAGWLEYYGEENDESLYYNE